MIQIAEFDDTRWKAKLENYRQAVIQQRPIPEAAQTINHTPYPYQRLIYTTRHIAPTPTPLTRYLLPAKPLVALQADDIYHGIHQITRYTRKLRQQAAALWADEWLDPFTYFFQEETPMNDTGGINIGKAIEIAKAVFGDVSNVEGEGLSNLYYAALRANEKVVYLKRKEPEAIPANVILLPLVELSRYPRTCAWCGTKTSSGIRALCDQHHVRYIVNGDFRNSPITYDDLARLVIQSDSRHRQNVMMARQLKAAS